MRAHLAQSHAGKVFEPRGRKFGREDEALNLEGGGAVDRITIERQEDRDNEKGVCRY